MFKHLRQSISYLVGTLVLYYALLPILAVMWDLNEQGNENTY